MRRVRLFAICLTMSLISGCAATSAIECAWVSKIRTSKDDNLTRGTKEQIVAHNENVRKNCK